MQEIDLSYYNEEYYKKYANVGYFHHTIYDFFNHVATGLDLMFKPATVIDVGCGCGLLVEIFRENGIYAFGGDASEYAIFRTPNKVKDYVFRSILPDFILPNNFPEKYDLLTCLEVMEHVPEKYALQSVEKLTSLSDIIIFSSCPEEIDDIGHVNVKPQEYWKNLFGKFNFKIAIEYDVKNFISEQAIVFKKEY